MTAPLLLSRRQAAKALGVGYESLNRLVSTGQLVTVPVGARDKVTKASIDAFVGRPDAQLTEREILNRWRATL